MSRYRPLPEFKPLFGHDLAINAGTAGDAQDE
jgi:hypothetical protein